MTLHFNTLKATIINISKDFEPHETLIRRLNAPKDVYTICILKNDRQLSSYPGTALFNPSTS